MCKRRVLMLQWKIYHFSSDFRANKRKFKLSSRSRASDTFQKNFFFPGTATRCRRRGKIWEKEAFCDDSTVKNLPFFKRFPKLFLEIDSWMQAPLSGCVISIQFCPWYRKLVLKVNLAWFQGKNWTDSRPSTMGVRLFTEHLSRVCLLHFVAIGTSSQNQNRLWIRSAAGV